MAIQSIDRQAPGAVTKEDANYRHFESCETCASFNGRIGCKKVDGHVSPQGVCNNWAMQEDKKGKTNKEVVTEAYEAEKKKLVGKANIPMREE